MTFINATANFKQFQLIKFINENCGDDHVISKVSIVLRRDKIEAPYYMTTKIRLSSCIDMAENGIVHAMDILNHNRMYNLTEEKYMQIRSVICSEFKEDPESDEVKIFKKDRQIKVVLMSKNEEEFRKLFEKYNEVFLMMDDLITVK